MSTLLAFLFALLETIGLVEAPPPMDRPEQIEAVSLVSEQAESQGKRLERPDGIYNGF
jgi:hypothetical protein